MPFPAYQIARIHINIINLKKEKTKRRDGVAFQQRIFQNLDTADALSRTSYQARITRQDVLYKSGGNV